MDLLIPLDRTLPSPLRDQLYSGLRIAILDGRLGTGSRLPASRTLAVTLGISRFTVDDAYSRLIADGYLFTRHGSGTYVAFAPQSNVDSGRESQSDSDREADRGWSEWSDRVTSTRRATALTQIRYSFKQGVPALDPFPFALWRRCRARVSLELPPDAYGYGSARGYLPLREAIQTYLARSRMLRTSVDQIVITSGTQQALDIVFRLFVDPGDSIVIEEPSYPTARNLMSAAGARIIPIGVDGDGLKTDDLAKIQNLAKLIYVTPSHQFPTGGVLPLHRRRSLLEWARSTGTLIVEDDYDSEFRYGQRPIEALAALDGSMPGPGSVIYLGTFSKVLFPAVRLGYVVLPSDLVDRFLRAKELTDRHPPTIEQATVAAFIQEGNFERHLARMRRIYASRQVAMLTALDRYFGGKAHRDAASTAAGLHMLVNFDVDYDEAEMMRRATGAGILIEPAGPCYLSPPVQTGALLGYAVMDEVQIDQGIRELAKALISPP